MISQAVSDFSSAGAFWSDDSSAAGALDEHLGRNLVEGHWGVDVPCFDDRCEFTLGKHRCGKQMVSLGK